VAESKADSKVEPKVDANDGFDAILTRLRAVVHQLESGELSLEQSLAVYEEGVQLARRGHQLLASAEQRVEILVSASGGVETAPFVPEDAPARESRPTMEPLARPASGERR
jgi:exodeoxyribonuclease VII small subunit